MIVKGLTRKMTTSEKVVKMSVTVSNSPVQEYFHLDDHTHSKKLLFFKRGGNQSTCRKTS